MSDMITFKADGAEVQGRKGASLLETLLREGFEIPHLCHHEAVDTYGACRLCLVEIRRHGRARIATSCNYPVMEGIDVATAGEKVLRLRRLTLELHLARAPKSEPLRRYAAQMGVHETRFRVSDPANDCILCGLCERVCTEVIGAGAIGFSGRGARKELTTPYEGENAACIGCGSCARICPTGCIQIIDKGNVREMPAIHARHELVPCRVCGAPTVTKAHAAWLAAKTKMGEADATTCDRCKAKGVAQVVLRTF